MDFVVDSMPTTNVLCMRWLQEKQVGIGGIRRMEVFSSQHLMKWWTGSWNNLVTFGNSGERGSVLLEIALVHISMIYQGSASCPVVVNLLVLVVAGPVLFAFRNGNKGDLLQRLQFQIQLELGDGTSQRSLRLVIVYVSPWLRKLQC